jgi:hypothetical protein
MADESDSAEGKRQTHSVPTRVSHARRNVTTATRQHEGAIRRADDAPGQRKPLKGTHQLGFNKNSETFTGNFCIDDLVLYEEGIRDFTKYADVPFAQLALDFFLPDDTPLPKEIENS